MTNPSATLTNPDQVEISELEREAATDLITACTMVHGWIMTSYLRGGALPAPAARPIAEMQAELLRTM